MEEKWDEIRGNQLVEPDYFRTWWIKDLYQPNQSLWLLEEQKEYKRRFWWVSFCFSVYSNKGLRRQKANFSLVKWRNLVWDSVPLYLPFCFCCENSCKDVSSLDSLSLFCLLDIANVRNITHAHLPAKTQTGGLGRRGRIYQHSPVDGLTVTGWKVAQP